MDALLPSEIARLVLGYLEDQNCPEAAKMFLQVSPVLQECYSIAQRGGKFTRRPYGITLLHLIDKFCAINGLVQERLSKLEDTDHLQTCDIIEQLRFLMDGSRGQRFVVNINVPSQNASQASGGSPIISSSMRKRRHSGPVDRERTKRPHKSNSLPTDRQSEAVQQWCDTVETTSLDQLPGHQRMAQMTKEFLAGVTEDRRAQCSSTVTETPPSTQERGEGSSEASTSVTEKGTGTHDLPRDGQSSQTCSTGVDTQELMVFTNTEVQTSPCDGFEASPDVAGGPVENLSVITKELLNRTDVQERIAETINRVRDYKSELSLKESSFSEGSGGECNTSIMRELDNAIKSIVIETETDPVFEQFLLETIGQGGIEGETSPDEDGDVRLSFNASDGNATDSPDKSSESVKEGNQTPAESPTKVQQAEEGPSQLPADAQPPGGEPPPAPADPPPEKGSTVLDDVNAEAILSIINVNNTSKEQKVAVPPAQPVAQVFEPEIEVQEPQPREEPNVVLQGNVSPQADSKSRKKRGPKPKREPPRKRLTPKKQIPQHEIPIPTLIVCSQEEIESMRLPSTRPMSQFVPIVPKDQSGLPPQPPLFLRTVNVVRSAKPAKEPMEPIRLNPPPVIRPPEVPKVQNEVTAVVIEESNAVVNESITLYGPENNAEAVVQAELPPVQLEDSMSISRTGLSPYLKLHRRPTNNQESKSVNEENTGDSKLCTSKQGCEVIAKRTPRSILKSRSKNHRLSLSTPRRRSSHIRALDFNTPTKGLNTSRRLSEADKSCGFSPKSSKTLSKACRTSLFKSPPFGGSPSPKKKQKTPVKLSRGKIPIATRSPAPKLVGGWDKITGVGMIIDATSQSSCGSPEKPSPIKPQPEIKKSWDADLRMSVLGDVQPTEPKLPKKKEKPVRKCRTSKRDKDAESIAITDDENDGPANSTSTPNPASTNHLDNGQEKTSNPCAKISVPSNSQTEIETTNKVTEPTTTLTKIVNGKGVTKKYAKLKTLTTTVTKVGKDKRDSLHTPGDAADLIKIYPPKVDLETPRKFDPSLVPPTPRVLSPSSNMTTPFAQVNEDSGKVQSFVSTPEFPPTPSIALTPKQSSEATTDSPKKGEFGSTYYEPSSKPKDPTAKNQADPPAPENSSVMTMLAAIEHRVTKMAPEGFEATSKLEITQFEVIKENLPMEQAIKELKISKSSDTSIEKVNCGGDTIETPGKTSKSNLESSGTADDSSGSDSDSSSSESSCSSSSCSCCDDTNNSSRLSTGRRSRKTPHKADCTSDVTPESPAILLNPSCDAPPLPESAQKGENSTAKENASQEANETSPQKVMPIAKTDEALKDADLETPAKDDGLLAEMDISETPSSSKAGIENLTNLNSKISAIIKEDMTRPRSPDAPATKKGPKIVSVEELPIPMVQLKQLITEDVHLTSKSILDAKLARELDEKRLRTLNKLRAKPTIPPPRARSSRADKEKVKDPVEPPKRSEPKPEPEKRQPEASQPVRKSTRNAERRARRGLSEPRESLREGKRVEPQRKAQSSRESSVTDETPIEKLILPIKLKNKEDDDASHQKKDQKQKEEEAKVEQAGAAVDAKEKNGKDLNDDKKEKDKENEEKVAKSKVDLVKRDLFSDEESDAKSSRAKPSQFEDKKNDSGESTESKQNGESSGELPGVLESLQLVPTNKSFEETDLDVGSYEHVEISFVYDDETVQPKKRRRKVSNSDLEMKVQVEDDSGEIVWKTMTCTPHEEIFNILPARKRRTIVPKVQKVVKAKPVTTLVSKRKGKVQLKNSKSVVSGIKSQPLATSSPVMKETVSKATEKIKVAKGSKVEEKSGAKLRKRKHSESRDELCDKKTRTTDPKTLLSQVNIDKFLNEVHGPES